MNLDLADQVAVVVGGAKGIGLAIARALAEEESPVAVIDVDAEVHEAAAAIAADTSAQPLTIVADATDFAAIESAANQIVQDRSRIDHVVYAAAVGSGRYGFPFWNLDPSDWRHVLDVNVMGAVNVAHAFSPYLIDARGGTMLFLSSVAGQIGSQTDPPYSAAKAAIINFAQCAAKDLAPYNVRVNTICPGMVQTALNQSVWRAWHDAQPESERLSYEQWAGEKVRRVAPLGRWQQPEDIAAIAVFLASPRAENITGQTINVDGGQVMHW